jgi:hypothetical protein
MATPERRSVTVDPAAPRARCCKACRPSAHRAICSPDGARRRGAPSARLVGHRWEYPKASRSASGRRRACGVRVAVRRRRLAWTLGSVGSWPGIGRLRTAPVQGVRATRVPNPEPFQEACGPPGSQRFDGHESSRAVDLGHRSGLRWTRVNDAGGCGRGSGSTGTGEVGGRPPSIRQRSKRVAENRCGRCRIVWITGGWLSSTIRGAGVCLGHRGRSEFDR